MSLKKFIFFITDKSGRSFYVENGVVKSTSMPKQLPEAPDGNQEISIGWERSATYYGNVRNFALPLGFVLQAATICRDFFYKNNLDLERYLLVKRLTYEYTTTTFKEYYKQFYKGQLDFPTSDDSQGEYRFNVGIMEGGLQKLLKANEGTQYEIPFDLDAKNVVMDGMYIYGKFRWIIPEYDSLSDGYPGLFQLPNDNPVPGLAIFDTLQNNTGGAPTQDTIEYFMEFKQDIENIHITGIIANTNRLGSPGPLDIRLRVFNTVSGTERLNIDLTPDDPYPENYNVVIDQTIDFIEGDRVFLKAGGPFSESNLTVEALSKPEDSVIRGFTIYDLGRKLIEKITGLADNFDAPFLETVNIILTSGDGVRGLDGAAVKTSWREYWKAVDVYCKAQMTIDTKIRIKARETAYDSTQTPVDLGEIKNFKCTPATDQIATSVKFGNAEQQVDDTNGKFDPMGFMIFSTPVKSIPDKQLDLQSPYKASPYEIEQTRANYEGKITTDKETDNDVFALAVVKDVYSDSFDVSAVFSADGTPLAPGMPLMNITIGDPIIRPGMKLRITGSAFNDKDITVKSSQGWFFGQLIVPNEALIDEPSVNITIEIIEGEYYNLNRSVTVTQLTDPDTEQIIKDTIYNVPLSPKRILLLHATWLAGMFADYLSDKLIYSSANRNKEMIAGGITEKADVSIVSLGNPMFLPKYFEFDVVSPVNMPAIMEANPNPVFQFTWKDNTYTGFFIRGGIALNDREEQTFKLLACPENNLLNLI